MHGFLQACSANNLFKIEFNECNWSPQKNFRVLAFETVPQVQEINYFLPSFFVKYDTIYK